jgi:hypothetical protein
MTRRPKRASKGFLLLEVLAALAVAILLMVPVASMIGGIAGTVSAIERSAARQQAVQAAALAAALVELPTEGVIETGGFAVTITPMPLRNGSARPLEGWALHRIAVRQGRGADAPILIETVRLSRQ